MKKVIVILTLLLAVTGCRTTKPDVTTLTPEAEKVWVTTETEGVAGCKMIGFVETTADANDMKNKTAFLGGNLLFITNRTTGIAYLCPDPVAGK